MDRVKYRRDRLRLALGTENLRLLLTFRAQYRRLLVALRGQDLRLLHALSVQNRGPLVALGTQLLLHRILDRRRRIDRLQLDPVDADPPLPGRLVEHTAQLAVDLVA